jgi:cholest-4-en-3-one 26-monooxygenase
MSSSQNRSIDLLHPDTYSDNPDEMYRYLRDEAPLYWDETNEIWAVSRYEDIKYVSSDPSLFTSTEGNRPGLPPDQSMIHQDGEQHTRQRGLVSKGFTPRRIAMMEGRVREIVAELLSAVEPLGECDIVKDLAAPLPMRLIGDMLGIPLELQPQVQAWTDEFTKGGQGPEYVTDEVNEAFGEFMNYHEQIIEERRANPGDDLLSIWLNAEIDGHKLDESQLLMEHVLLLVGGSETTRNVISGGLEQLIKHPDQMDYLREHPEAMPTAVEEMIRWATPFIDMVRTATRDTELHGKTIKQGQQIAMLYNAANRDPRVFKDPDKFDILRKTDMHPIAFGYGKHFCLGASLARLEIKVTLEAVVQRLRNLAFKPGTEVERVSSSFIRGLASLPVVFTPRTAD